MTEIYELHPGPIIQGDLLVVEVGGKLVQSPQGGEQWFVAVEDDKGQGVNMKPVNYYKKGLKARKYVASGIKL
jgi:hypothetical protein